MEPPETASPELVHTPGCAAIADVAAFFKISPANDIKCVAYMALKRGAKAKDGSRKIPGTAWPHFCAAIIR
jgi:prolyl-tRNA synthetase